MRMETTVFQATILAATLAVAAMDAGAQQFRPGGRGAGPVAERLGRGPGPSPVEGILRMRDRLELTEEQITRLDGIRAELVERQAEQAAQMNELRSQGRAGTLDREAATGRLRELRASWRESAEQQRAEVEALLTDAQRETLREVQSRRRAFEAGRRSAMRDELRRRDRLGSPGVGPGPRGTPGEMRRPGLRGPDGVGPRRPAPRGGRAGEAVVARPGLPARGS